MKKSNLIEAIKIAAQYVDEEKLLKTLLDLQTTEMPAEEAYYIGSEVVKLHEETDARIAEYERSQIDAG